MADPISKHYMKTQKSHREQNRQSSMSSRQVQDTPKQSSSKRMNRQQANQQSITKPPKAMNTIGPTNVFSPPKSIP